MQMNNGHIIELRNVTKRYSDAEEAALQNISFYVRNGEFLTLLGPSGCGKTTTLHIIGGFSKPTDGDVIFEGQRINDIPPNKRNMNTVFQNYALFRNLNVYENIAFSLRIKNEDEHTIRTKVGEMLELVGLEGFGNQSVVSLSGGQQQRVAIARALINCPAVLLLDEPMGALDLRLRKDMQIQLKRLQRSVGITFIYVTHEQEEALALSDTIILMNLGCIQQIGTPEDIYNEPQNAFAATFIGSSNLIDGIMLCDYKVSVLGVTFDCVDAGFGRNNPVDVVIRPEDVILGKPNAGLMNGIVKSVLFKGVHFEIKVLAGGFEWLVHSTRMEEPGTEVSLFVEPSNIQIMNKPRSKDEEVSVDE